MKSDIVFNPLEMLSIKTSKLVYYILLWAYTLIHATATRVRDTI